MWWPHAQLEGQCICFTQQAYMRKIDRARACMRELITYPQGEVHSCHARMRAFRRQQSCPLQVMKANTAASQSRQQRLLRSFGRLLADGQIDTTHAMGPYKATRREPISYRWPTLPLQQVSTCLHCGPLWAFRHGSCPVSFRPTRRSRQYRDAALDGPMLANRYNDLARAMGPCEAMRIRAYKLLLANSTSSARVSCLTQWAHAGIPSRQLSC